MGIEIIEERFSYKEYIDKRRTALKKRYIAKVKCACGNIFYPFLENVTRKLTKACRKCSNKKHNSSRTKLYKIWTSIKQRCYNKNDNRYYRYGNRGITMYKKWINNFESFKLYIETLNKPKTKKRLSLDRINNNGNYEPDNLRWATYSEQLFNTERSINRRKNGK